MMKGERRSHPQQQHRPDLRHSTRLDWTGSDTKQLQPTQPRQRSSEAQCWHWLRSLKHTPTHKPAQPPHPTRVRSLLRHTATHTRRRHLHRSARAERIFARRPPLMASPVPAVPAAAAAGSAPNKAAASTSSSYAWPWISRDPDDVPMHPRDKLVRGLPDLHPKKPLPPFDLGIDEDDRSFHGQPAIQSNSSHTGRAALLLRFRLRSSARFHASCSLCRHCTKRGTPSAASAATSANGRRALRKPTSCWPPPPITIWAEHWRTNTIGPSTGQRRAQPTSATTLSRGL